MSDYSSPIVSHHDEIITSSARVFSLKLEECLPFELGHLESLTLVHYDKLFH